MSTGLLAAGLFVFYGLVAVGSAVFGWGFLAGLVTGAMLVAIANALEERYTSRDRPSGHRTP